MDGYMKLCKKITISLGIFFMCLSLVHALDTAKIDRLQKEITEITNRALARGSFTPQEEKRIQEIQEEMTAEYTSDPQTKRMLEQKKQQEQQEEQKQREAYAKSVAITALVPPKLSVKYKSADDRLKDKTLVITWDNNLKRHRVDYWYEETSTKGRQINIINTIDKTLALYDFDNRWHEEKFDDMNVDKTGMLRGHIDFKKQMARWRSTFVRQSLPDRTYAGKVCKVYLLKEVNKDETLCVTYAFWNDVVLFYEYALTRRGESSPYSVDTYEAVSVTETVPDTAFTKTLNRSGHR
jgi:hypothetical protein